jgi:hypothetical protein
VLVIMLIYCMVRVYYVSCIQKTVIFLTQLECMTLAH